MKMMKLTEIDWIEIGRKINLLSNLCFIFVTTNKIIDISRFLNFDILPLKFKFKPVRLQSTV